MTDMVPIYFYGCVRSSIDDELEDNVKVFLDAICLLIVIMA